MRPVAVARAPAQAPRLRNHAKIHRLLLCDSFLERRNGTLGGLHACRPFRHVALEAVRAAVVLDIAADAARDSCVMQAVPLLLCQLYSRLR